ncbi:hypothetical protein JW926_02725 [Candidatus Sumerlaeota bacterium]|nr:hypothetical protein [Candidatus Sumerlaeota bacterium]
MKKYPLVNQRNIFYILTSLIVIFIILAIYRSAPPPENRFPPEISMRGEDPWENVEQVSYPIYRQDREMGEKGTESSFIGENGTNDFPSGSSFGEEEPESLFMVKSGWAITPRDDFVFPRFSPDGLNVICRKANCPEMFLVSLDGAQIRQISDEFGINYNVRWSNDGTMLIVKKGEKTKVLDLTGKEVNLTDEELRLQIEDRSYVKDHNIYIKNPQGGEDIMITHDEDAYIAAELSYDGCKVAYQGLTTGIHIKDMETREVIDLGSGSHFSWLPDGMGLIYNFTKKDGMNVISGDIFFAYADGSGKFNITKTPDVIELNPCLSPDGRYLTYEIDGQIFVTDLWNLY